MISKPFRPWTLMYVGEKKKQRKSEKKKKIFWRHFKLWLFPSQHFYLDVLETNNCFICNFRKCTFHITTQQTPKGSEKQRRIFWINASSDVLQMTASQSVIQSVNQCGGSAGGLVSKCLCTLHLMVYDVLKCKI